MKFRNLNQFSTPSIKGLVVTLVLILYFYLVNLGLTGEYTLPKIIEIFGFDLHLYSLCILAGIVVAFTVFKYIIKREQSSKSVDYYDMLLYAVVFGIIGARLWHVVTDWHLFKDDLTKIFYIWNGGLGIFGALIFGTLGIYIFTKKNKLNFTSIINTIAITLPLAQAIGRIGNFINQELYGPVTNIFWKWYISATDNYHHPAFLYEQILNLILFGLLFARYKSKGLDNKYVPLYLIGYSLIRFFVEFYRLAPKVLWGMSVAQTSSLIIIGVAWMWWKTKY